MSVGLYVGDGLRRYAFGDGHPFGPDRLDAFWAEAQKQGLEQRVTLLEPVSTDRAVLERFHTKDYVDLVIERSRAGTGYLDYGDTPAFPGVYEAAACVVGTVLDACERVISGELRHAFVPIAGLHHAQRNAASGFCALNDCGIAIETLRAEHGIERVAYVDIDAHHGDGVFYSFEDDAALIFADLHEDGRFLYPGTGHANETGRGEAEGTKLNIPMPPESGDAHFMQEWERAEAYLDAARPEFILFQCGADSLAGDPITHLRYSAAAHGHAAQRLCALAERHFQGRLVAMGGGGYNRANLAAAWTQVLERMVENANRATA